MLSQHRLKVDGAAVRNLKKKNITQNDMEFWNLIIILIVPPLISTTVRHSEYLINKEKDGKDIHTGDGTWIQ